MRFIYDYKKLPPALVAAAGPGQPATAPAPCSSVQGCKTRALLSDLAQCTAGHFGINSPRCPTKIVSSRHVELAVYA